MTPVAFTNTFNAEKTQLLTRWLSADLDTPVSAWLKLCRDEPYALLLESVEGGAVLGRYSAIAFQPDLFWKFENGEASTSPDTKTWTHAEGKPLDHLKTQIRESRIDHVADDLPPMAASGLFGFLGYDMIRLVEDVPAGNPDTLGIPDALLIRPQVMVIFDNVRHMMLISVPVREHKGNGGNAKAAYQHALGLIDQTEKKLLAPFDASTTRGQSKLALPLTVKPNVERETYHDMVRQAADYIHAGEIFQVVPSQRFRVPFDLPAFDLYRALRRVNPSPFLFHLKLGDFAIVGSSPEILVRVPCPQRCGADGTDRQRESHRPIHHRILFTCDAYRFQCRRKAAARYGFPRRHVRRVPGGHGQRRAQNPRHGNYRGTGDGKTRLLRRLRRLF